MRQLGEKRNVPDKLIDSWIYKIKDVEIPRLDYQKADPDDPLEERKHRSFDEKFKPARERIRNKIVTIKVWLVKRTLESEEAPHPLESATLKVTCPELDLKLEGTDVQLLKDAMWSMLDQKFEITWERYYVVEVVKTHPYNGDGTGLEIIYRDVYKGTTHDGKHLMKVWRGYEQKIEAWPGAFKDSDGKILATIEANDENKAALEEFCSRMDLLRGMLAEFLKPEVILKNLTDLTSLKLLPQPEKNVLMEGA